PLPLNDTGQLECYGINSLVGTVSAATPDPEPAGMQGQDCTRGRDAMAAVGVFHGKQGGGAAGFDFSRIAGDGSELVAAAPVGEGPAEWACTRDNRTGLVWELKLDQPGALRHYQ